MTETIIDANVANNNDTMDAANDAIDVTNTSKAAEVIDIIAVAREAVSEGTLTEEGVSAILEAATKRSQTNPVTQAETKQIMKIVRDRARGLTFDHIPVPIRIIAILMIFVGALGIFDTVSYILSGAGHGLIAKALEFVTASTLAFYLIMMVLLLCSTVLSVLTGIRMLRGKSGAASILINTNMALQVGVFICVIALYGADWYLALVGIRLLIQVIAATYLNPILVREAELKMELRRLDTKTHAEQGTLGLADPGKGFIRLDFFNVFWTFVTCCVLGLIVEIIWHMVVVEPGVYQDRAGLLFGPFSPIYGFGAVFMTVALNRFKEKNLLFLFAMCTIIGGAFEYSVSWFMEVAFGTIAWDYHGKLLGDLFDGRTCLPFAMMFGVLGVAWIKLLLPSLLKLINKIPWKLRYSVTAVCAALMIANGIMTFQALDNWTERLRGHEPATAVEQFYADNFDNDFMAKRFESMSLKN